MENKHDCSNQIGFKIKCLSNLLRRRMLKDCSTLSKDAEDFCFVQGWIIDYVAKREEVYQRDIEKRFNMRRSSVTKTLQNMEKNGLIERRAVASDARLKRIVLTEKARSFNEQMRQSILVTEQSLKKGLTEQEVATFLAVADKIFNNLKEGDELEQ